MESTEYVIYWTFINILNKTIAIDSVLLIKLFHRHNHLWEIYQLVYFIDEYDVGILLNQSLIVSLLQAKCAEYQNGWFATDVFEPVDQLLHYFDISLAFHLLYLAYDSKHIVCILIQ